MLAPREIDEYLLPTERRVIRVRMHWAVMANNLVFTGLFLLLMIIAQHYLPTSAFVDNLTFYLALASVVRFTVQTILWWIERIVITDKRVMLAEGIVTHNVGMMPLSKVTDLTFRRTFGGRLLGYGTLIVESAGQIQALNKIRYMPRPEEIYEALSELIFGEKGKTRATGMLARPRFLRG
ncbi:MAG: PH domain-containing protein [Pseudonocardia sp.]|nr:PH domain-containing protein [Pseudonocardia sp.]